ncbi:MAG: prepilin-type N-terminal cleavage/methylation domain-containing protein [Nitrospirales bacterium]
MTDFVVIGRKGYTLLELMIVVAIVGILVTLAIPMFQQSAMKAKEAALKQNLFTMRAVIDQFYADRGDYPESLESLVEEKYLRAIPVDPFTKSATTWNEIYEEQEEGDDSPAGVSDVKSGSDGLALNGTPYKEW